MKKEPINNAGIRISGFPLPPFLAVSYNRSEFTERIPVLNMKTNICVEPIRKSGSKNSGNKEANSQAKVCQPDNTGLKFVCTSKED
jgi:hypothetical protein